MTICEIVMGSGLKDSPFLKGATWLAFGLRLDFKVAASNF